MLYDCSHGTILGDKGWKCLYVGLCFSEFSAIQGKMMAKPFEVKLLQDYTIAIITAHAPGCPYK